MGWCKSHPMACLNPCSNGRYSQRGYACRPAQNCKVLILVLMEDTHREAKAHQTKKWSCVLILVLMEDTHRGRWVLHTDLWGCGLNPCSNGRYSQRQILWQTKIMLVVLILVLMEDTHRAHHHSLTYCNNMYSLNPCSNGRYSQSTQKRINDMKAGLSLNPCSNGRYSQSAANGSIS